MKIKFTSEQSFQALWLVSSVGLFGDKMEILYGSVYPLYPSPSFSLTHIPDWLSTCYVAKNDLEYVILLELSIPLFGIVLGMECLENVRQVFYQLRYIFSPGFPF